MVEPHSGSTIVTVNYMANGNNGNSHHIRETDPCADCRTDIGSSTIPYARRCYICVEPARDATTDLHNTSHDNNAGTPDIVNPITLPDANGRVLFAQITVPRSTLYGFRGSIAYLDGTTGLEINSVFAFASVPAPGAISLLALAGLCGRPRRRRA